MARRRRQTHHPDDVQPAVGIHATVGLLGHSARGDTREWTGSLGGQLMYGWIWRKLPGGSAAKAGQIIGIMVVVIALLFLWMFPWITSHLPIDQVTV